MNIFSQNKLTIPLSKMFKNPDGNPSFINRLDFDDQSIKYTERGLPNMKQSSNNVKFNTMSNFIRTQNSTLPKVGNNSKIGMTFSKLYK